MQSKKSIIEVEINYDNNIPDYASIGYSDNVITEVQEPSSKHFQKKDEFLQRIFSSSTLIDLPSALRTDHSEFQHSKNAIQPIEVKSFEGINNKLSESKTIDFPGAEFTERIIISNWKNVENISARLIEKFENTIVLECLMDRDQGIYEERLFPISLFEDYELEIGNYFFLRFFNRKNEIRLEIHNDPGLTLEEDFPKIDFVERFRKSRLFKST